MTLYAHSQRGTKFGDTSDIRAALLAAAAGEASAAQVGTVACAAVTVEIP